MSHIVALYNTDIFQQQTLVLKDVSLEIEQGEFVYLIGKTGSGKSSLLKVLYGDLPVTTGEGYVADFNLRQLTWKHIPMLRRKLGIVFQDFQLLTDRTIEENLRFVLKATGWKEHDEIEARIDDVLEKVGLKTKGFKMPHELSGGEQQRIVIARALLNYPELILADEPTGNLDPETSTDIISLLRTINSELGTAVVMATHDYEIIKQYPSRIIKCEQNHIMEQASAG